jgi:hypothetical protein
MTAEIGGVTASPQDISEAIAILTSRKHSTAVKQPGNLSRYGNSPLRARHPAAGPVLVTGPQRGHSACGQLSGPGTGKS